MNIADFLKEFFHMAFGEAPKVFYALIGFVALDYIAGVCVAIREKKLSSKIGAKGISRKVMIFVLVALSSIIDRFLLGDGSALCTLTILFYCSNELISIMENANRMGLPLPQKLSDFLADFRRRMK